MHSRKTYTLYAFGIGLCLLLLQGITAAAQPGFIAAGRLRVHYTKQGSGPPLLLLHAGYQQLSMWDKQVAYFSPRHTVICFDLPGHGATKGIDTTLLIQDLLRICLDSLHIQKTAVLGLSLGSSCATELALAYPERVEKLILVSPGLSGWKEVLALDSVSKQCFEALDKAMDTQNNDSIVRCFTRIWAAGPRRKPGTGNAHAISYVRQTTLRSLQQHPERNGWPRFAKQGAAAAMGGMRPPLLLIAGDADVPLILSISHWIHHAVAGSREIIFSRVAHMLNLEIPDPFNQVVGDFLDK